MAAAYFGKEKKSNKQLEEAIAEYIGRQVVSRHLKKPIQTSI